MTSMLKSLTLVLALGLLAGPGRAQDAAKPKADPPKADKADKAEEADKAAEADTDLNIVKVLAVKNTANKRAPVEVEWYRVHKDQEMSVETIIRTGFNSHVTLAFADNSVVTIESCTKMGITEFRKHGKVTKTHLHLKYGAIRATIHKARGPNDWRVQTPVATLSALGTTLRVEYRGGKLLMEGKTGVCGVSDGPQKTLRPGEFANGKDRSVNIVKAVFDVLMLDAGKGLGSQERDLLRSHGGGRNIFRLTGGANRVARPTVTSNSGGHIIKP